MKGVIFMTLLICAILILVVVTVILIAIIAGLPIIIIGLAVVGDLWLTYNIIKAIVKSNKKE